MAIVSGWFTAKFDTVLQGNATKQLHAFDNRRDSCCGSSNKQQRKFKL